MITLETDLILIKNADKTQDVESCYYSHGKYHIRFKRGERVFSYNESNVEWYQAPEVIDITKQIVYENNQPIASAKMILNFGAYFRVIFNNNFNKIYPKSAISMEESTLSNPSVKQCLKYLSELSAVVGLKLDDGTSFLKKQYDEITHVSPRSVLSVFLGAKFAERKVEEQHAVIYPFGFNASQKAATVKAMTEQMSVIEGPPGTGKTQTILNIIANAVINNQSVAIVSNNNAATENVIEKLQKDGLDFITAFLGSSKNRERFFDNQTGTYPPMVDWELESEAYEAIRRELSESQVKLDKMLAHQRVQAKLKQTLAEIKTEYGYFKAYHTNPAQVELKSFRKLPADKVLHLLVDYERSLNHGKLTLKQKIKYFFQFGIYQFNFYKNSAESIIGFLQNKFYSLKITEIEAEIDRLQEILDTYHFADAMKQYSADSMKLFKATLVKRFSAKGRRDVFDKNVFRTNFNQFIAAYPVVLSTTHSLRNSMAKDYLFDYLLIDEASQVDLVTGALALSCAKNAVIVGDDKQLPNVVTDEVKTITNEIYQAYNMSPIYHFAEQSLLTSVLMLLPDIPKTLLQEHYRCHPKIIGFCNQKYYQNELVILSEDKVQSEPLIVYKTVKGNHARGTMNQRQIDVVMKEVMVEQGLHEIDDSIGIITPYRKQVEHFDKATGHLALEADTVHKYQGREKDVIILSTVVNDMNPNDFADDSNLINVAVSRAVKQLIIVTAEGSEEWKDTNVGDLIGYIKYNNFEVINSEIHSVFDYLYGCYAEKLNELMMTNKQVSEHSSENLMNIVVEKVLSDAAFNQLAYVLHQPLRMLIKDTSKLSVEEKHYAMNEMTHTDFLIFNKLNKQPVLVIEVDGHAFHANSPEQLRRDQMKDRILNKYGIPIIRLKTTGSEEEKVLKEKLRELMRK